VTDDPAPASITSASTGHFFGVLAIGFLIEGSTVHFDYICDAVSHTLLKLQKDGGVPVVFGC